MDIHICLQIYTNAYGFGCIAYKIEENVMVEE
jgi:hypothetical protein